MHLKLVIAEPRAEKIELWKAEFEDVQTVEVLPMAPSELSDRANVDAELLPSLVAMMRYNAPASESSMILSTNDEPGSPPWVVTTPQVPLHEGYEIGNDGRLVHVRTRTASDKDRIYDMFCEVFAVIDQFNTNGQAEIKTLGFGAESVCYRCDLSTHIDEIKRAYVEHCCKAD